MARALRIEYPGAVYHVTSRGNERRDIFLDDADRVRLLELLGEVVRRFGWIVTAYTLMTNHFHLVIETPSPTLSRGMQWLNASYAAWFNRRHRRWGHLIDGVEMLVAQAVGQFEAWTGESAPVEAMTEAALAAIAEARA